MIHKMLGGVGTARDAQALFELLMYFVSPKPGTPWSTGQGERVLAAPVTVLVVQGGVSSFDPVVWARGVVEGFKVLCRAAWGQRRLPKRLFEHVAFSYDATDDAVLGITERERGVQAISFVLGILAASSLSDCPLAMVVHGDRDSIHVHCAIMGCDAKGRIWSSRSPAIFAELQRLCRETEAARGLYRVIPDCQVRGLSAGERQSEKRRGIPAPRAVLQVRLSQVLERRPSAPEFAMHCVEAGVLIVPNVNTEGRVMGLSYRLLDGDDLYGFGMKRHFSGTDLGKRFVWSSVAAAIAYEEEKHRALVDQWALEADRRLRRFRCFLRPAPDLNFDASIAAAKRRKKKLAADPVIIQRPREIIVLEPRPRSIRRALEEALRRGWLRLAAMPFRQLFEPVATKLGISIIVEPAGPAPSAVPPAKPQEAQPESQLATASPAELVDSDPEQEESSEIAPRARRPR